ncbi:MAG: tetratricopeptide repeat protein [Nevskia sp.]|nr:tetratricopeptide repeat protein [Nevskia sp.]
MPNLKAALGRRDWARMLWIWSGASLLISLGSVLLLALRRRPAHRASPEVQRKWMPLDPAATAGAAAASSFVTPQKPPSPSGPAVGDLLMEAEISQLYGHMAEAAQLIETAVARAPEDKELRVKLAEAYFAADMPDAFRRTSKALEGQLDEPRQRKLAGMLDTLAARSASPAGNAPGSLAA